MPGHTVQSQFSDILFSEKSRFSDSFGEDYFFKLADHMSDKGHSANLLFTPLWEFIALFLAYFVRHGKVVQTEIRM